MRGSQWSAKPLLIGSIPITASNKIRNLRAATWLPVVVGLPTV
jgi:hypothetical protein